MTAETNLIPFPHQRLTPERWTTERRRAAERAQARAEGGLRQWHDSEFRAFEAEVDALAEAAGIVMEDDPA